jgi:hypothetical protein
MTMWPQLDATPLDTDGTDIYEVFKDIAKWAKEHPGWTFICADDPGVNYAPPRVPRMGWCASKQPENPYRDAEQIKVWTITLTNVRVSMAQGRPGVAFEEQSKVVETMRRAIQTAAGRKAMLNAIVGGVERAT